MERFEIRTISPKDLSDSVKPVPNFFRNSYVPLRSLYFLVSLLRLLHHLLHAIHTPRSRNSPAYQASLKRSCNRNIEIIYLAHSLKWFLYPGTPCLPTHLENLVCFLLSSRIWLLIQRNTV